MGVIERFGSLTTHNPVILREPLKEPEETFRGKPILRDAKRITLAEYAVDTKDAITAHHLKDYRRTKFNLVLLPKVDVMFNRLLEGSEYWSGLLHNENTNHR